MSLSQKNTEILIKVSTLMSEGYTDEVEKLISKIESRKELAELPSGLKKIFDEVGNNPIDEKEIYDLSKEIQSQDKSIIDLVLRFLSEDDMDEYDIDEVSYFAGAVIRKINKKKDENGVFKSTPNTSMWQRPKPSSIKKYEKLLKEAQAIKKDDTDSYIKINEKIEKFLFQTSKVDEDNLTDWEKELVIEQTTEAIKGYLNSFMGKR